MTALYVAPQRAGLPVVPYLQVAEFKAAPTGIEMDDLYPGGTPAQQDAALYAKILQASSWIDGHCNYILGATVDINTGRYRLRGDGTVHVPLRGIPFLELDSFTYGPTPSASSSLSAAQAVDVWAEDNILIVPIYAYASTMTPRPFLSAVSSFGYGSMLYCTYTYVNGYANTLLANGTASSGSTSITLQGSALGIYPGTSLVIYDTAGGSEAVTVDQSYTAGSLTVPLASPLVNAHVATTAQPVSVSNLPPRVKEAAILATGAFIKTRGGGALIDGGPDASPGRTGGGEDGGVEDLAVAEALLEPFILPMF